MRDPILSGPATKKPRVHVGLGVPRFRSGDLITAEALNVIVDALNQLSDRVAALEKRCL